VGRRRPPFRELPEWTGIATRLIHGARLPELNAGAVVPPIYQSSTFHFPTAHSEASQTYLYTRQENPSQEVPAELLRNLEGAEAARVFGSGMGAIATSLLALLDSGDEVVATESLYGGTFELFTRLFPRLGIRVRWVPEGEGEDPSRYVSPATKVVYLETPTNPTLRVHDLSRWAAAADKVGAVAVVDNTFATPINQRPLSLGADLVVHSATKYLGGHSDLLAGAVAGPATLLERIRSTHIVLGSVLDPFAAFLLTRGMRTLSLRVERQSRTAARLVDDLARHPKVERVFYPGRGSSQEETIASRQMIGRGGVLAFTVAGGYRGAQKLLEGLRFIHVASSLGGVESLVSLPRDTSHPNLSPAERERRGIAEGMVRLSVGIEDAEDLRRDLVDALGRV
jgi:cystathionine beta-lyase/cystathionine gamma-synthase